MKKHILILATAVIATPNPVYCQSFSDDFDAGAFYDWFQDQSNASELYTDNSTLYTFASQTPVFSEPCEETRPITVLTQGEPVRNKAYPIEVFIPTAEINGYHDIWYQIILEEDSGKKSTGYIWGGHIAKAWFQTDVNRDGTDEFILFGLSEKPRDKEHDIRATIKVLQSDSLLSVTEMPGMCVYEECTSDVLLRAFIDPTHGIPILEASTLSIGCMATIERSFLIWKGEQLECIYYGEFTTGNTYQQSDFAFRSSANKVAQIYRFGGIDSAFNPTWKCIDRKLRPTIMVVP